MNDAARPLEGMRILITRPKGQSTELADAITTLGGIPLEYPTIRIDLTSRTGELERAAQHVSSYDWIVFTSANGARAFLAKSVGKNPKLGIAAVGPATAQAIEDFGCRCAFTPSEYLTERLARELPQVDQRRVLLVRAQKTDAEMASILKERGAFVDEVQPYRVITSLPAELPRAYDAILFTSPSTVLGYKEIISASHSSKDLDPVICCIGPVTAKAAEKHGFRADIVAKEHTARGLVNALVETVRSR